MQRPGLQLLVGIAASAALSAAYARGGTAWVLGFALLVPWLITLDRNRSLRASLVNASAMAIAYTAGVFAWFGMVWTLVHSERRAAD